MKGKIGPWKFVMRRGRSAGFWSSRFGPVFPLILGSETDWVELGKWWWSLGHQKNWGFGRFLKLSDYPHNREFWGTLCYSSEASCLFFDHWFSTVDESRSKLLIQQGPIQYSDGKMIRRNILQTFLWIHLIEQNLHESWWSWCSQRFDHMVWK